MVNKEEIKKIEEVMESRGYTKCSQIEDKNGNISTLFFLPLTNDTYNDPPVEIFLNDQDKHIFQFSRVIFPGGLHLVTGKCGSIWDDTHFEKMKKNITEVLSVLRKGGYDV